jgi:5,10-methylenetetrahydromethanopterin reductase
MPATVYNPLFVAMEITTLARAFPNRILPGLGHGVGSWMAQIGAAPKSSLKALGETVISVRQLLSGDAVTMHGDVAYLDNVQMQLIPDDVPPIYVGAMREKTLQLAGRVGDGTILTGMSSPAYVQWAWKYIRAGMVESGRSQHRVAVYLDVKVKPDAESARSAARRSLAGRIPWADSQVNALGITDEVEAFIDKYGVHGLAEHMPDAWLDSFAAAGTPEHAAEIIMHLIDAGADSVVFQPLDGDPACLEEYSRYLIPLLKTKK